MPLPLSPVRACRSPALLFAAAIAAPGISAPGLVAQQLRAVAPAGAVVAPKDTVIDDPGKVVEMFENPNLDRYLRRAQTFLGRADYAAAIEVLQDVIEGRTVEVVAIRPEDEGAQPGEPAEDATAKPTRPDKKDRGVSPTELDARNSVFSYDGRLYRPVRRLCHEMLSKMPDVGIEIYRTTHEFAAEELFQAALQRGSATALEQVANRYFITLPAGRAMMLLGDRLMHEGRYRAAVQVLRDLLEIYPEQNRKLIGVRDVWCRFKIALCLRLAGEGEAAGSAVQELAEAYPEESLRILGQLETIRDLPASKLFQRDMVAIASVPDRAAGITWLGPSLLGQSALAADELVPLWQYRFHNPEPYQDPKPNRNRNNFFIDGGNRPTTMPYAGRYGPATWVSFAKERVGDGLVTRALFLEHFRLRMTEAPSGLLLRETQAALEPQKARADHPRVRIAASDYALLRPVEDDERRYVIVGHEGNTTNNQKVWKTSHLIAYERAGWEPVWSSADWAEGENGLQSVTFLAAPTVFGERLLLPALRRGSYSLECLDRSTGRPLWHAPLHAGGSEFYKAPGCPVIVQGGIAFVATNAGCIAAVDAFAGDLRWIRRYERRDPVHSTRRRRKRTTANNRWNYNQRFAQAELKSFLPSDLVMHDGLLIAAPCDSEVLMALDTASGKPVWMLDGRTRYAPYGKLRNIVGDDGTHVFLTSDTHLVCVEMAGGLVRWCENLPAWSGPKNVGRGRGVVVGSQVILPGVRELLVFDVSGERSMRRLKLPSFEQSRDPLQGSFNITSSGPWLAIGYQGGVELYSTRQALGQLAQVTEDPLLRASHLTRSGAADAAEQVLAETIRATDDQGTRRRAARQLLSLVRRRAADLARERDLAAGLDAMDAAAELLSDRDVRLKWHLARIEMCKQVGDLRAHEDEQQRLYDYMEGRG